MELDEIILKTRENDTSLTSIYFASQPESGSGTIVALGDSLKTNRVVLSIILKWIPIREPEMHALRDALISNHTLKEVSLWQNKINDKIALVLFQALRVNRTLRKLDLRMNEIGNQGAAHLGGLLQTNCTLIHIDLGGNQIGDQGAQALGRALEVNHTLQELHLWGNQIGDLGVGALSRACEQGNDSLAVISLGSLVSDAGAEQLGQALRANHSLTSVSLGENKIGSRGIDAICEALNTNRSIIEIFLSNNPAAKNKQGRVNQLLERNRELRNQAFKAINSGSLSVLVSLLDQGVSIYIADDAGHSLLHRAAQAGQLAIVRELVQRRLSPILTNLQGQTAVDLARKQGHAKIIAFLESYTHTPTQLIQESLEETLNRCLGIGERRFQQLLAQYQEQGRGSFAHQLEKQEAALSALVEQRQAAFSGELINREGRHASELLQRVFEEYQDRAVHLSPDQAQEVRQAIDQRVAPDLEEQFQRLTTSTEYDRQTLQLQVLFSQELSQRQSQLIAEAIHAQEERRELRDQQSPLVEQYAAKQRRIQEQLALQSPQAVCIFYNTIEQVFGARVSSAVMLVNGCIKRADTKRDKAISLGADITSGFCEAIPVVGGVVGSLVSFGIQEAGGAIVDHAQGKKFKNTQAGVIRLKDAMTLSELCARRVAQSYVKHITEENVTADEAKKAGKRAAKAMYHLLSEGRMQEHAQKPPEEKMDALVHAVHEAGRREKGIFRKHGGVFDKVTEPELPSRTSPAQTQRVTVIGRELQDLKEQNERAQAQLRNQIEQLQRRQPVAATAKVGKLTTHDDRQAALRQLNTKSPKAIANHVPVKLSCADKTVTLTYEGADAEEKAALRELAGHLDELFDGTYLKDVSYSPGYLTLKLKSSLAAEDMEQFLNETELNVGIEEQ